MEKINLPQSVLVTNEERQACYNYSFGISFYFWPATYCKLEICNSVLYANKYEFHDACSSNLALLCYVGIARPIEGYRLC